MYIVDYRVASAICNSTFSAEVFDLIIKAFDRTHLAFFVSDPVS